MSGMTPMTRLIAPIIVLGLALTACSSSSSKDESSSSSSSTAAGTSTDAGTDGGAGEGSDPGTGGDLCAEVSTATVASILGIEVDAAEVPSAGARFRSANTLPACTYDGDTFAVVAAEFLPCEDWEGLYDDPIAARTDLPGAGDEAKARYDAIDPTLVIDTVSKQGSSCLYLQIYQGTSEEQAVDLTNAFLDA